MRIFPQEEKENQLLKKVSVSSLKTNQFIKQLFRKKMNSVTTQLLKKSKTEEGLKTLNRELQDIRSRQEDNYYDYYYTGHFHDNDFDWKDEGIVRKRWERDQELIESYKELFTWDEKFRLQVQYKVAAFDEHKFQSDWSDDRSPHMGAVADGRNWKELESIEKKEEFNNFETEEYYNLDDFYPDNRGRRTMLVKVSNLQKIEKGFGE